MDVSKIAWLIPHTLLTHTHTNFQLFPWTLWNADENDEKAASRNLWMRSPSKLRQKRLLQDCDFGRKPSVLASSAHPHWNSWTTVAPPELAKNRKAGARGGPFSGRHLLPLNICRSKGWRWMKTSWKHTYCNNEKDILKWQGLYISIQNTNEYNVCSIPVRSQSSHVVAIPRSTI